VQTSGRGRRVVRWVAVLAVSGLLLVGLVRALDVPAAIAPAGSHAAWSQFGHDATHTGATSAATAVSTSTVDRLRPAFTATLPGVVDGAPVLAPAVPTPAGVQDLLVTTSRDGWVTASNASSGDLVWTHQNGAGRCRIDNGDPCYSTTTPAVDPTATFVYAYGLDGKVHKYALGTGAETLDGSWPEVATVKPADEKSSGALTIAATPTGTYLYVVNGGYPGDRGDYQGHVTTIDLDTGTQHVFNTLCSDDTGHLGPNTCPGRQSAVWARAGVVYDPATHRVYLATGNGTFDGVRNFGDSVLAVNPDGTGTGAGPVASYTPANQGQLDDDDADLGSTAPAVLPALAGSRTSHLAVQSGKDGQLRLLDLDSLGGLVAPGHPAGELQVIGVPQGGEVLTQPATWTDPADHATWVFVSNDNGLAGVRVVVTDGVPHLVPAWTVPSGGTSPVVAGGVVFYLTDNGALAVDPSTGRRLWAESSPIALHWQSPIVTNDALYYPDGGGHLKAFTLPR
jgi:outer membrane protein assembly factor BamB